jgi:hypothetical protein
MSKSRQYLKDKWINGFIPQQLDFSDIFESFFNITDDLSVLNNFTTEKIQFSPNIINNSPSAGDIWWNDEYNTLNICPGVGESILQLGQETWIKVFNPSINTILNGKAVYISGAHNNEPVISICDYGNYLSSNVVGLVTSEIPPLSFGFITTSGLVHDIDTSSFNAGQKLYLGLDGNLINYQPPTPYISTTVGYALNSSVSGSLYIKPATPITTNSLLSNSNAVSPSDRAVKSFVMNNINGLLSDFYFPISHAASNFQPELTQHTILVSGDTIITLPPSNTCPGKTYVIKKIDATGTNTTIIGYGSELLDGAISFTLHTQYQRVTYHCDGEDWWRIA